jgi:hypothetical protein
LLVVAGFYRIISITEERRVERQKKENKKNKKIKSEEKKGEN